MIATVAGRSRASSTDGSRSSLATEALVVGTLLVISVLSSSVGQK